jgi:hypothetical protein
MIWLYIIDTMPKVEGIFVRQAYALGFALADVMAIMFENKLEFIAKKFGSKWRKHKKRLANRKK